VFGYVLNGEFADLSSKTSAIQSGSNSFVVKTGDVFGFAGYAVDNFGGPSTSYVFNFMAPVPEVGTLAMWATGALLLAANARRRKRA
jgi:hypothetical protein